MSPVRILLADDHTLMRAGLRLLLERHPGFEVVGEAANGRQALELAAALLPDILVIDVGMPVLNGIEAVAQLAAAHSRTGAIVLSMHSDEAYLLRALQAGARGYLVKDTAEADLVAAIHAVRAGKIFVSPSLAAHLPSGSATSAGNHSYRDSFDTLSPREKEILRLLATGTSTKDAAAALGLSAFTVETHRGNLMQKLNLHSIASLVLYAVRKGIVS